MKRNTKPQPLEELTASDPRQFSRLTPRALSENLKVSADPFGALHALLTAAVAWARLHPDRVEDLQGLEHALAKLTDEDLKPLLDPTRTSELREMAGILFTLHGARRRLAAVWLLLAEQEFAGRSMEAPSGEADLDEKSERVMWYIDRLGVTDDPGAAAAYLQRHPLDVIRQVFIKLDKLKFFEDYVDPFAARLVEDASLAVAEAVAEVVVTDFPAAIQLLVRRVCIQPNPDRLIRAVLRSVTARDAQRGRLVASLVEGLRAHDTEQVALLGTYLAAAPANIGELVELFSTTSMDRPVPKATISIPSWGVSRFRSYSVISGSYTPVSARTRLGTRAPDFPRRLVWSYIRKEDMGAMIEACGPWNAALAALTMLEQLQRSQQPGSEDLVREGLFHPALLRHIKASLPPSHMGQILDDIVAIGRRLPADDKLQMHDLFRLALGIYLPEIELSALRRVHFPYFTDDVELAVASQITEELRRRLIAAVELETVVDVLEYESDTQDRPTPLRTSLMDTIWRNCIPRHGATSELWWGWTAALGAIARHDEGLARACVLTIGGQEVLAWEDSLRVGDAPSLVHTPRTAGDGLRGMTLVFDRWADLDAARAKDGLRHLAPSHLWLMQVGELSYRGPDLADKDTFRRQKDTGAELWCQMLQRRWPEVVVELACWFIENAPVLACDKHDAVPLSRALGFLANFLPSDSTAQLVEATRLRSGTLDATDWRRFAVLALVELPEPSLDYRREMLEIALQHRRSGPRVASLNGLAEWQRANQRRWPELSPLLRSL